MRNAVETAMEKMDLLQAIENLKNRYSELKQYAKIMEKVRTVDVSTDTDFQREFNYFYKVRRDAEWRIAFYGLFEKCKTVEELSFPYILRTLCAKTGNVEASFSSKLLSTLNPDMPIWDSIVLSRLGLKPSQATAQEKRLADTEKIYQDIVGWYQEFIKTSKAQDMINAFDKAFPEFASMSTVKKIDFLLWGSGEINTAQ